MSTFGHGHPNIVRYEKVIETASHIFVIMELIGRRPGQRGIDLFEYIDAEKEGLVISEAEARGIFRQVVGALKHIHDQDVIHGDIKPENVMLGP